jgi:multimeric flavodoxin WrbA
MAEKHIAVIFHSQSGSTQALAEAVVAGIALEPQVRWRLLRAMEAGIDDLRWCDGVIFGTPENLGYIAGGMKDFFDRTFYPAQRYAFNKPYGLFVSAGNDGSGAVAQLQRIVKGYPLKPIAEPLVLRGEVAPAALQQCRDLGQGVAAGLTLGIF